MAGQVMEAQAQLQRPMTLAQLPPSCKNDLLTTTTTMPATSGSITTAAAATAADLAYLQHLQNAAAEAKNNNNGNGGSGGARGEQCPRCASHDTKFCYYNNYNTSQPRHFCRSCRRYWTLGGSLRNVPIGGSTRKRPRLAHPPPPASRPPAHVFGLGCGVPPMPPPPSQGLLGSLFALSAAPLLEGRGAGFDLGLGLPAAGHFSAGGDVGLQMQDLGLRGDGGGPAGTSPLFWSTGLLDNDSVDTWKVPGTGAGAMWPESSAASPAQAGGLLHGGAQLM